MNASYTGGKCSTGIACQCRPGFSGALCELAAQSVAGTGCVTTMPLLTTTIEGFLNPG